MKRLIYIFVCLLPMWCFAQYLNVRNIIVTSDVDEAVSAVGNVQWFQAESVQYDIYVVRGTNPVDLTQTNLFPMWEVTDRDTRSITYIAQTGTVVNGAIGHVRINVSPTNSNLTAGDYESTVRVFQPVNSVTQYIGTIARSIATVKWSPDSASYTLVPGYALTNFTFGFTSQIVTQGVLFVNSDNGSNNTGTLRFHNFTNNGTSFYIRDYDAGTSRYQTAYNWGNHATNGYLTNETDSVWRSVSNRYATTSWVASLGYNTNQYAYVVTQELDPHYVTSVAASVTAQLTNLWTTNFTRLVTFNAFTNMQMTSNSLFAVSIASFSASTDGWNLVSTKVGTSVYEAATAALWAAHNMQTNQIGSISTSVDRIKLATNGWNDVTNKVYSSTYASATTALWTAYNLSTSQVGSISAIVTRINSATNIYTDSTNRVLQTTFNASTSALWVYSQALATQKLDNGTFSNLLVLTNKTIYKEGDLAMWQLAVCNTNGNYSEMLTNGTFTGSADQWALDGFSYNTDRLILQSNVLGTVIYSNTLVITTGSMYRLRFDVQGNGGVVTAYVGGNIHTSASGGTFEFFYGAMTTQKPSIYAYNLTNMMYVDSISLAMVTNGSEFIADNLTVGHDIYAKGSVHGANIAWMSNGVATSIKTNQVGEGLVWTGTNVYATASTAITNITVLSPLLGSATGQQYYISWTSNNVNYITNIFVVESISNGSTYISSNRSFYIYTRTNYSGGSASYISNFTWQESRTNDVSTFSTLGTVAITFKTNYANDKTNSFNYLVSDDFKLNLNPNPSNNARGSAQLYAYGSANSTDIVARLLINFVGTNGAYGSNVIYDASGSNYPVIIRDNDHSITIEGTNSPYTIGNGAGRFNGSVSGTTTNFLIVQDADTLEPGSNNWTVECWIMPTNNAGASEAIFNKGGPGIGSQYDPIGITYSGSDKKIRIYISETNSGWKVSDGSTNVCTTNVWNHIAVSRIGDKIYTHVNGSVTLIGATLTAEDTYLHDQTNDWNIGGEKGAANGFQGYISDFRYSLGAAKYTNSFTPPTVQFAGVVTNDAFLYVRNGTNTGSKVVTENSAGYVQSARFYFDASNYLYHSGGVLYFVSNNVAGVVDITYP